jgi:hypothetical protein
MLKVRRGRIFLFALFAVSLRVLTGAPEAQVNFTSLLSDNSIANEAVIHYAPIDEHAAIVNSEKADSIPEKHRTYATYKKYTTPDKSLSLTPEVRQIDESVQSLHTIYLDRNLSRTILDLRSTSPPVVLSVSSHTGAIQTYSNNFRESNIGTSTVDNSVGGLGGLWV